MAKGMTFKMTGLEKAVSYIVLKKIQVSKNTEKGIKEAGEFIKEEVNTDEFRDSIDLTTSKARNKDKIKEIIKSNLIK